MKSTDALPSSGEKCSKSAPLQGRIAFVGHDCYDALVAGRVGRIGGAEHQVASMAKWFAAKGHDVTMLTWDEGPTQTDTVDGVNVVRICRRKAGVKGLRFFHPKWTGLVRALRDANADVYYVNCSESVTGQVALWCRKHAKKLVFSTASDKDCDRRLPHLRSPLERWLYAKGIALADLRIVQTHKQQRMLMDSFSLESVMVRMPCLLKLNRAHVAANNVTNRRVLWLGRICHDKCPDRLFQLARRCPDLAFDLVGPFPDSRYGRKMKAEADAIQNVAVHGPQSRESVQGFLKRAFCLCATSIVEGFPNTFLEAWSIGLPVVSTFDPDMLIKTMGLGISANGVDDLRTGLYSLLSDRQLYEELSRNAKEYYTSTHRAEAVYPKLEHMFFSLETEGLPTICRDSATVAI